MDLDLPSRCPPRKQCCMGPGHSLIRGVILPHSACPPLPLQRYRHRLPVRLAAHPPIDAWSTYPVTAFSTVASNGSPPAAKKVTTQLLLRHRSPPARIGSFPLADGCARPIHSSSAPKLAFSCEPAACRMASSDAAPAGRSPNPVLPLKRPLLPLVDTPSAVPWGQYP